MSPWAWADQQRLLDIADSAIFDGLAGRPLTVPDLDELSGALREPDAAFVTLHVRGELNGCTGSVGDDEAVAHRVARHARMSAFGDPRLPPLRREDYGDLDIEISILSPPTPMPAPSAAAVAGALRPEVDGLVLSAGDRRALFLPSVWEQLPDPLDFVCHLVAKAGLSGWPATMRAQRFEVERFSRRAAGS